jgi:hypothetical protein
MSTCGVQASGAIELFFYGELPEADRAGIERHVRRCDECRRALDDLITIREALASRPDIASPPGGDWSRFMARLDDAVARDRIVRARDAASVGPPAFAPGGARLYGYLALAAVLTLITLVALLSMRPGGADRDAGQAAVLPATPVIPADPASDPALRAIGEEHFERSKLVVLGLATKDPGDGSGSNWAYEQELASALLDDTRLYRLTAEQRGMETLAGVMRDLELLLLEASMTEQADAESLESLQQLIRRRDLLTKMEVVKTSGL